MENIDIKKIIQHKLVDRDMSLRQLAAKMNTTVQNLSNKLCRGDMKISDFIAILDAMDYKLEDFLIVDKLDK